MPPRGKKPEQPGRSKNYKGPGRLGDAGRELFQDARAPTKLIDVLRQYGMERNRAPISFAGLSREPTMEELGDSMAEAEAIFENLHETLPNDLPGDSFELEVEMDREVIPGPGGGNIALYIYRPVIKGGPLPCILYMHSGSMAILKTTDKVHSRWCVSLAAMGMVVIAVDFRNAWTPKAFNPFPAALEDCSAAVKWVHAHKDQLNIRNLVLHGDGGGGNLVLATALKGNREGWSCKIDGVYASAPLISNAYHWPDERKLGELPSLVECDGYSLSIDYQAYVSRVYTPRIEDMTNPLAWPYHAMSKDMEGLPPHTLAMDELDPFRDEGMVYFRKLLAAGVNCSAQMNLGHTHNAALIFRQALPGFNRAAVRQVTQFAKYT